MVLESSNDSKVQAEVDKTAHALRTSLHPMEWAGKSFVGGIYARGFSTGLVTGVAADGSLVSMQFNSAESKVIRLLSISVNANLTTVFAAAQEVSLDIAKIIGTAPTADTGGTDIRSPSVQGRRNTSMRGSSLSTFRAATTAALTDGSGSVESVFAIEQLALGNTANNAARVQLWKAAPGEHPLDIGPNEGIRIRNHFAMGAGGVVRFNFNIEWAEIPTELFAF